MKQTTTKLRDDIDQIETEKGMWKTKYDELVRNRIENRTFKVDFPKIENGGHQWWRVCEIKFKIIQKWTFLVESRRSFSENQSKEVPFDK